MTSPQGQAAKERAEARRASIERLELRNHAAGLHVSYVETCKACRAIREGMR